MGSNANSVREIYACFGAGDIAGVLARLDPDVAWEHDWGMQPLDLHRERRGRDAVPGFFAGLTDFEFLRFEPFDLLEGDGRVVALIHVHLRHKATGRAYKDLEGHLWSFGPDGLVARFRHLADTRQLAWACGVT